MELLSRLRNKSLEFEINPADLRRVVREDI
jgi:hypothetical protein